MVDGAMIERIVMVMRNDDKVDRRHLLQAERGIGIARFDPELVRERMARQVRVGQEVDVAVLH